MCASVATDFKPEQNKVQSNNHFSGQDEDFLDGGFNENDADLSPVHILDFDPENKLGGHPQLLNDSKTDKDEISLALPDLSAIISEKPDKSGEFDAPVITKVDNFFGDGNSDCD